MTTKYGLQWLVAGRITAGRGFATFSNLEMQHSPKIFCIFLQKVLAKNTKAGLAKIKLFSKSKYYTYHGIATYTVDLGKLTNNCILLDEENQTVILKIPHAAMEIDIPLEEMEIGDTQKGLLAFGELSMNDDESKKLYSEAKKRMEEKLDADNIQEKADRMAKLSVWEIYQPMVAGVANGYALDVQFID